MYWRLFIRYDTRFTLWSPLLNSPHLRTLFEHIRHVFTNLSKRHRPQNEKYPFLFSMYSIWFQRCYLRPWYIKFCESHRKWYIIPFMIIFFILNSCADRQSWFYCCIIRSCSYTSNDKRLLRFSLPVNPSTHTTYYVYYASYSSNFSKIYRCWIVWGRNTRVVIVPSVLAVAFLGSLPIFIHSLIPIYYP